MSVHTSFSAETTLALGKIFFVNGWCKHVEQYSSNYFAFDEEHGDSAVIGAVRHSTLVHTLAYDDGAVKIL